MRIGGLEKITLLDFPGRVGATVFTVGCNFHCPFCHNGSLLSGTEELDIEEVKKFFRKRKAVLEGVVISGGEPTLHADLPEFCAFLKGLGYLVKLDTNGSHPEVMRSLLDQHLIDYIAMDIKTDPAAYPGSICPKGEAAKIREGIGVMHSSGVPHEFRIPCAAPYISEEQLARIFSFLGEACVIYLQKLRLQGILNPRFFESRGRALSDTELAALRDAFPRQQNLRIR